ncbi:ribosome biogenesis GTPase YlqF [Oscillospiraceae bacterium LCP25S3_E10]|nr:ribosome biogenesis GTPase YlqF [Ruminococcus sp.]MDD6446347.1 ribosome biogenesis GTPase YlqF [Ruminococcus sp.]MDY2856786.1 ribosome biogenesis GTPase YlqF [Oscillospiraceae bacterium]
MAQVQNIQWFPGHMTKTKRKIQASLKLVDIVAEIIDARIPVSSHNPDLDKLIQSKPRIVLMNKCDMADKAQTDRWVEYYRKKNIAAIPVDCKTGKGLNRFIPTVRDVLSDKIEKWEAKGMRNRSIHIMVVGIPNVGKSSFINKMAKKGSARVEDRPGVTRGNQWFSIGQGMELLDTPGVLWPKFDDPEVGEKLAFTGAVKDQVMDTELLAFRLLEVMCRFPTQQFIERFKLQNVDLESIEAYDLLELIARKRGMLMSGGRVDTERASVMILDEYRSAKLGKITLECV